MTRARALRRWWRCRTWRARAHHPRNCSLSRHTHEERSACLALSTQETCAHKRPAGPLEESREVSWARIVAAPIKTANPQSEQAHQFAAALRPARARRPILPRRALEDQISLLAVLRPGALLQFRMGTLGNVTIKAHSRE